MHIPNAHKTNTRPASSHSYDAGIQTFDTANAYSNGLSEIILGKAIKKHNLPRDEIVIMTKVYTYLSTIFNAMRLTIDHQVFFPVAKEYGMNGIDLGGPPEQRDAAGLTNQYGLSRKVRLIIST